MKNSNETIGNRTRDLPACSAVPTPTAPPRTPKSKLYQLNLYDSTDYRLYLYITRISGSFRRSTIQQEDLTGLSKPQWSFPPPPFPTKTYYIELIFFTEFAGTFRTGWPSHVSVLKTRAMMMQSYAQLNRCCDHVLT